LALISNENQFCDMHNVRVKIIGNKSYLPQDILQDIEQVEERTKHHTKHVLFIAFPYTSRDDIWYATDRIISKVNDGEITIDEINEDLFQNNFYYDEDATNVDILVRTSGHTRLSDYMLWQCHQDSVIEYPNTLWPDYRFFSAWWTIFKWSYYKTLMIQDAEQMQLKKVSKNDVDKRYKQVPTAHPPFASVNKV
jgi:ditrans,polycis-polyprenyl diphosphate synthase